MRYDFTTIMDRVGKDALAVDALGQGWAPGKPREGFDPIPMWVADMNFPTAPAVTRAMVERISHPCFGYFDPREEYFDAIIRWQTTRNGVVGLEKKHIGYENGVLGGILSALGTFCSRGDNVLLNSPVYMGFMGSLTNAGYHIVESPLVLDENGVWRLDLADMENKIVENRIHAALFCYGSGKLRAQARRGSGNDGYFHESAPLLTYIFRLLSIFTGLANGGKNQVPHL